MISVLSRYPLTSYNTFSFLQHIYSHSSTLFHSKRVVRFIDIHHLSTLSSSSCTYPPCSVCAQMYMYDEIFIHIHPQIDIHPFRSRSFSITTCVSSCAYMYLIWRVHIYPHSSHLLSLQSLIVIHTHDS